MSSRGRACCRLGSILLIFVAVAWLAPASARSETFVVSTSQVCTGNTTASEASFATVGPFAGATVLDAAKQPISGAPISASVSGFDYVPEPAPLAGGLAALLALAALARRRGR